MADVIEYGNVYFLYQPKVEQTEVEGIEDVQRFYMVLSPQGAKIFRLLVMGGKRLPEIEKHGGERYWGFVDDTAKSAQAMRDNFQAEIYRTKTRGERLRPAARPAGEGVYALTRHDGHTHFAYALELPEAPGPVQKEFNIAPEGSFIISVKNPEKPAPRGVGLSPRQKADLPKRLQEKFRGRRFVPVESPAFLDYPGTELVMIGAEEDAEAELDIELDPQHETENTAEIFNDLRLRKSDRPLQPLFEGEWA